MSEVLKLQAAVEALIDCPVCAGSGLVDTRQADEMATRCSHVWIGNVCTNCGVAYHINQERENNALRAGLSLVATNLGNGSFAAPTASIEFLCVCLPREVKAVCDDLRTERDALRRRVEELERLIGMPITHSMECQQMRIILG